MILADWMRLAFVAGFVTGATLVMLIQATRR